MSIEALIQTTMIALIPWKVCGYICLMLVIYLFGCICSFFSGYAYLTLRKFLLAIPVFSLLFSMLFYWEARRAAKPLALIVQTAEVEVSRASGGPRSGAYAKFTTISPSDNPQLPQWSSVSIPLIDARKVMDALAQRDPDRWRNLQSQVRSL